MRLLVDAIKEDDAAKVAKLCERFPDARTEYTPFAGGTWLHYAASMGSNSVVEYLLNSGSDINAGSRWSGANALCFAAHGNQLKTAEILLERGIGFDVSASVRNALFAAVVGRSPDIVKLLLNAGIDPTPKYTSKTMSNMDATAFALMRGERDCAQTIALWLADGNETRAAKIVSEADRVAALNAGAAA